MSKKSTSIYLSAGGCNFRISFHFGENTERKYTIHKEIQLAFRNCIDSKYRRNVRLYIDFFEMPQVFITRFKDNLKRNFCLLYSVKKPNRINAYFHISLSHFAYILNYCLINLIKPEDGFILHSSSGVLDDKCYIFTGKSGSGKSTVSEHLRGRFRKFSDDLTYVRRIGDNYFCYQLPLIDAKDGVVRDPEGYRLGGVYILRKSADTSVDPIADKTVISGELITQLSELFWQKKKNRNTGINALIKFIHSSGKFYYLHYSLNKRKLNECIS